MFRKLMITTIVAGSVFASLSPDQAHCDTLDGPVAKAGAKALSTGNVNPVLAYAPVSAEAEIRIRFDAARKVRSLNNDSRALAENGDLSGLKAALAEEVEHAPAERFAHLKELKKVSRESQTSSEVPHARERISTELGFITFAETIRQAAMGGIMTPGLPVCS